jgi:hypothetical protein
MAIQHVSRERLDQLLPRRHQRRPALMTADAGIAVDGAADIA